MIKNKVYSSDNIRLIYSTIVNDLNLHKYPDHIKKSFVSIIQNNIKDVCSQVNESKVNNVNFNKIFTQVNDIVLKKSSNYIQQKYTNFNSPQISQVAFQRDVIANPNKNVQVFDRPLNANQPMYSKDIRGIPSNHSRSPDRNFHLTKRDDVGSIEDKYKQLQDERNFSRSKPINIPDKLIPMETRPTNNKPINNSQMHSQMHSQPDRPQRNKPNFTKFQESKDNYHLTNEVQYDNNDNNGFLSNKKTFTAAGSIDEVFQDKTDLMENYIEDNRSLEERMKDYSSININIPRGEMPKPMDTRENKPNTDNLQYHDTIKEYDNYYQEQSDYEPSDNELLIDNHEELHTEIIKPRKQQKPIQNYNRPPQNYNRPPQNYNNTPQNYNNTPQNYNNTPQNYNNTPQNNIDISYLKQFMDQLDNKISLLKNMEQKTQYNVIIDTRLTQNHNSNYRWDLPGKINASKIELINYSIPSNWYNIYGDNNIITYELPNNEDEDCNDFTIKNIRIPTGSYTIHSLIDLLNKKSELHFELNENNFIKISYDMKFRLKPTRLTVENFNIHNNYEDFLQTYEASGIWDLRELDIILLFINNINEEDPFCILHPNGKSTGKIEFDTPKIISHLDIRMETPNGTQIDFQNRYHILTFKIDSHF